MEVLERIAYHLYVQGVFSRMKMNRLVKEGYLRYFEAFLYDPLEKELASVVSGQRARREEEWQYEDWEKDYMSKDLRVEKELLELFTARNLKAEDEPETVGQQRPKSVELKVLLRSIKRALERQETFFDEALLSILPTAQNWRQAARILADMQPNSLFEKLVELLGKKDGVFTSLWNFLGYDGFLFPEYSGGIITAYKKITAGTGMAQLGQYHWALEHPEIYDVYEIVQAKASIARAFSRIILERDKLFLKLQQKEFHSLAYSVAVLLYSALRWEQTPWTQPSKDEEVPFWIPLNDLASPAAFSALWLMNPGSAEKFTTHFFEITRETRDSLHQNMLRSYFNYCDRFAKNVEQAEFVEQIKGVVIDPESKEYKKQDIFQLQQDSLLGDAYWRPFFKSLPPKKWQSLLVTWWENLKWEALGLGVRW
ncbi:hypothetical protein KJ865_09460, partial [Myxococcota bacterium]|nr:hypothetical protein [Myxococcota bacterium]